jgi:hypothetical protein
MNARGAHTGEGFQGLEIAGGQSAQEFRSWQTEASEEREITVLGQNPTS